MVEFRILGPLDVVEDDRRLVLGGPKQRALLALLLLDANQAVSRAESIRKFRVLPVDFTTDNDYITPSLKVKRANVAKDFAADIEALYAK